MDRVTGNLSTFPELPGAAPVIVVDHVWKSFRPQSHQVSLRQEAMNVLKKSFRRPAGTSDEPFWALRDVTFRVRPGESVALVGRNGSGKTTLLRVLSGITRPSRGTASVGKRFATLIGLGAGFNMERTGRENIFLNAAIQGVPPRQAVSLLAEIVAFAELGDFIDVPVKRYSSGMVTRLGFSIAVHISPDIIFIDEALSVGDAAFQEKCMDRILEMRREGRTIIFVSHAAATVRQVCERAIWLHQGEVQIDGPTDEVLLQYDAMLHREAMQG